MSPTVAQAIAALPPDAIAQVVNAYRDALTESTPHGLAYKHEAAAQAFRDALAAVLPRLGDAPLEPPRCPHCERQMRLIWACMENHPLIWQDASVGAASRARAPGAPLPELPVDIQDAIADLQRAEWACGHEHTVADHSGGHCNRVTDRVVALSNLLLRALAEAAPSAPPRDEQSLLDRYPSDHP